MSEKKFYVYLHRYASGPKQGEVFYVGKGNGNRHKWTHKRSKYWRNIFAKYGFVPEIVMRFENESCAFSFERALIRHYGRRNLCNLTDGGEGVSGFSPTKEQRANMARAQKGRKHSKETREKMSKHQSMFHPMRGKRHTAETINKLSGKHPSAHPMFDDEERCFVHSDGTVFVGTRYDLNSSYSLDPSSTSKMIRGLISHHKGWRLT
jgi:hypothetical protein